jgi:hypothetical protein
VCGTFTVPCFLDQPGCPTGSRFAFADARSNDPVRLPNNTMVADYGTILNDLSRFPTLTAVAPDFQQLWDRSDPNGYAQHMTTDPLPDTPPHTVLMQSAVGDHQVANGAADVEVRTIGATSHGLPDLRLGLRALGRRGGLQRAGAERQHPARRVRVEPGPARRPAPHGGGPGPEGRAPEDRRLDHRPLRRARLPRRPVALTAA